jgi:ubiquinone biosynthesis O-methyltransferase
MPLDNDMYDRLSHTWWEEGSFLNFMKTGLNPVRFGYMHRVLTESIGVDPGSLSVLDVGCGGGLLAEEFAQLGCRVTGVDPSAKSIEEARRHAATAELTIDYRTGCAEQLPTDDGAYDVVYCCDVLEHVDDVRRSINEIAAASDRAVCSSTTPSTGRGEAGSCSSRWRRTGDRPVGPSRACTSGNASSAHASSTATCAAPAYNRWTGSG